MVRTSQKKFSVSVFGNPDLSMDSLPLRILPMLQKHFSHIHFFIEDPNEIDLPKHGTWIILDTVRGLKDVAWVSLEDISSRRGALTAHDYDLSTLLLLAKKLDSTFDPKILGVPEKIAENVAVASIVKKLEKISSLMI